MTALCILFALAFFVLLLSRIHFHFSFNLTISRDPKFNSRKPTGSGGAKRRVEISGEVPSGVRSIDQCLQAARKQAESELEAARKHAESDLCSALVNLGVKRQKAVEVAKKAMQQADDFDSRLKWAVRNAA